MNVHIILVEGSGGSGKSTLAGELLLFFNSRHKKDSVHQRIARELFNGEAKQVRVADLNIFDQDFLTEISPFPIEKQAPPQNHTDKYKQSVWYFGEQIEWIGEMIGNHKQIGTKNLVLIMDRGFMSSAVYHFDGAFAAIACSFYASLLENYFEKIEKDEGVNTTMDVFWKYEDDDLIVESKLARIMTEKPLTYDIIRDVEDKTAAINNTYASCYNYKMAQYSKIDAPVEKRVRFFKKRSSLFDYGARQRTFTLAPQLPTDSKGAVIVPTYKDRLMYDVQEIVLQSWDGLTRGLQPRSHE